MKNTTLPQLQQQELLTKIKLLKNFCKSKASWCCKRNVINKQNKYNNTFLMELIGNHICLTKDYCNSFKMLIMTFLTSGFVDYNIKNVDKDNLNDLIKTLNCDYINGVDLTDVIAHLDFFISE